MLNEVDREKIRAQCVADNVRMQDAMPKAYLGKFCPLIKDECKGPACSLFLATGDETGKITGGACCIPLIASQVGPIAENLERIAHLSLVASNGKLITPTPGSVIR